MQQTQQLQKYFVQGGLSVQSSSVANANSSVSNMHGVSPSGYPLVGSQVAPAPIAMPTPQRFVSRGPVRVRNFRLTDQ